MLTKNYCNNDITMIDGVLLDMLNNEKGCVFFF